MGLANIRGTLCHNVLSCNVQQTGTLCNIGSDTTGQDCVAISPEASARLVTHVLAKKTSCCAGVERLAFSVTWDLTPEGKIVSQWAGRSIIKSCVKLAYGHAQEMIEGTFAGLPDQATPSVELFGYEWPQVCLHENFTIPF